MMRTLFLLMTTMLAAVPLSAATSSMQCASIGLAGACGGERSQQYGTDANCGTPGSAYGGETRVIILGPQNVVVYGYRYCNNEALGPGEQEGHGVAASSGGSGVARLVVAWWSYDEAGGTHSCGITIGARVVLSKFVTLPCVAGDSPEEDWGRLLP